MADLFNVTSLVDADGARGVIYLRGEIDSAAAKDVIAEAGSLLSRGTLKRLVIDLEHVTFIDASGIGVLVQVHQMTVDSGGTATLRNTSGRTAAVLNMTPVGPGFASETPVASDD